VQHLHWMLESIAADIRQPSQPQGAMDKAHQLIPIQKFLTGLKSDVKETSAAIKGVSKDVAARCMEVAGALLVPYVLLSRCGVPCSVPFSR
jgi:hypothetical protein